MAHARTTTAGTAAGAFTAMRLPSGGPTGPQMQGFWVAQEKILNDAEAFARHWFVRRHEAALGALKACEQAAKANPTDAEGALQAFRDWQVQSAGRMADDMREWAELWMRCAGHLANREFGAEAPDELQGETAGLHVKNRVTPA